MAWAQRADKSLALGLVSILLTVFATCAPLQAGDRALYEIIGYSPDNRYFAFEEYGIQDGSGLAYASIYMIDLVDDRWVVGTPVLVQSNDETEPLYAIRERVRSAAAGRLADLEITVQAQISAAIGDAQPDRDGKSLSFGIPAPSSAGEINGMQTLALTTFPADSSIDCQQYLEHKPVGFALEVEEFGVVRSVHRDGVLPRSRGCPIDYRISAIVTPFQDSDLTEAVAIISVYAHGFEGPDRRFVAIPLSFGLRGN